MPTDAVAGNSLKIKPVTRSGSIRQSLNLASVSRALADVINKDTEKNVKKGMAKESNEARRSSGINSGSVDSKDFNPKGTTEQATVTRRTVSATIGHAASQRLSLDESSRKPTESNFKPSTLRPRPSTSSGLPKYRPKAAILQKPPLESTSGSSTSAARSRKRSNISEETEDKEADDVVPSPLAGKAERPISPLPSRAALKALSPPNGTDSSKPTTNVITKLGASSKAAPATPPRPNKMFKATIASTLPRPPSSTSSSGGSFSPRTPSTSSHIAQGSPSSSAKGQTIQSSSLSRHARAASTKGVQNTNSPLSANVSILSEEGAEQEDVKFLLAPVAPLTQPTPAMPRMKLSKSKPTSQTPVKPKRPARTTGNKFLSPARTASPARPRRVSGTPASAPRSSILSWEQLANNSPLLNEDEVGTMLNELSAPFSGSASPTRTSLSLSDSPSISAINTPAGRYGSISQVLLPDVTPSPAGPSQKREQSLEEVDSALVTLLRLQLASAETIAKDRLIRLQQLEVENYELKAVQQKKVADSDEVQVKRMQKLASLEEENSGLQEQLEEQLVESEQRQVEAVQIAVSELEAKYDHKLERQRLELSATSSLHLASSRWAAVKRFALDHREVIDDDRNVLSLLLAQLDLLAPLTNEL